MDHTKASPAGMGIRVEGAPRGDDSVVAVLDHTEANLAGLGSGARGAPRGSDGVVAVLDHPQTEEQQVGGLHAQCVLPLLGRPHACRHRRRSQIHSCPLGQPPMLWLEWHTSISLTWAPWKRARVAVGIRHDWRARGNSFWAHAWHQKKAHPRASQTRWATSRGGARRRLWRAPRTASTCTRRPAAAAHKASSQPTLCGGAMPGDEQTAQQPSGAKVSARKTQNRCTQDEISLC